MLAQSRRRAELGLLILAILITGGAYTLASLGQTSSVPANIGPFFAIITALFFAAHIAIRRLAPEADGLLFPLVALLNGIGYVFIARLDPKLADNQATWTFVGIAAFIATLAFVRRSRDLQRYRYTFLAVGLLLLVLPLAPGLGVTINGARIWVALGPISFQPGEFAKIAFALFFASYLVEKRELLSMATWPKFRPVLPDLKHLGPVLLAWGIAILVMTAQKDLGSSLLLFFLFIAMLWVATGKVAYPVAGAGLFGGGVLRRVDAVLPRAGPRRRLAQPVDLPAGGLPGGPGLVRHGVGRRRRHGHRPRPPRAGPVRGERLHLRRRRRGARPARRHRGADGLPAVRRFRPPHRRWRPSTRSTSSSPPA